MQKKSQYCPTLSMSVKSVSRQILLRPHTELRNVSLACIQCCQAAFVNAKSPPPPKFVRSAFGTQFGDSPHSGSPLVSTSGTCLESSLAHPPGQSPGNPAGIHAWTTPPIAQKREEENSPMKIGKSATDIVKGDLNPCRHLKKMEKSSKILFANPRYKGRERSLLKCMRAQGGGQGGAVEDDAFFVRQRAYTTC